ncbi:MAG: hypothetical protein IAF38_03300, partial [Bacteroidia bacterium]|nr:hypothetical protein [Bacteroidia bacterium]
MRKHQLFVIAVLFLISGISKSQVLNWDTAHIGGMGDGNMQFESAKVYNNILYLGSGDGSSLSKLFYSTDGFNYDTLLSYNSVRDVADSKITEMDSAGGKLFFSANNFAAGARVYEMSGTTVGYVGQPAFAGGPASSFGGVSALKSFNVGGADSLYVAFENYTNGAEIWKTSLNPPYNWTLALATEDSIGGIYDLAMFNGKIYAAAQLGYIFESADGVNWAINANSANGFGNNDVDCFNVLSVFNGKLFAGIGSYNNAVSVWSTADGITWDSLAFTNINQSGLSTISHFTQEGSTLWMTVNGDYGSAFAAQSGMQTMGMSFGPIVLQSIDGGLTFDRRSVNNFGEFDNDGVYNLTLYKNNLFASGPSFYGNGGRVYHTCLAPMPSITHSMPLDTTCVNDNQTYFGNTLGATNFSWYDDANFIVFAQNTNIIFPTGGNHTVKFIAQNYACVDSAMMNIYVTPQLIVDSVTAPSGIQCVNTNMTLAIYTTGGTMPLYYNWTESGSTIGNTQSITIPTGNTSSITATYYDHYGCSASGNPPIVTVFNSTPIYGTINYSLGSVTNGNMYLIKQGASSSLYDTMMVQPISAAGDYFISGLTAGNYYIRAE